MQASCTLCEIQPGARRACDLFTPSPLLAPPQSPARSVETPEGVRVFEFNDHVRVVDGWRLSCMTRSLRRANFALVQVHAAANVPTFFSYASRERPRHGGMGLRQMLPFLLAIGRLRISASNQLKPVIRLSLSVSIHCVTPTCCAAMVSVIAGNATGMLPPMWSYSKLPSSTVDRKSRIRGRCRQSSLLNVLTVEVSLPSVVRTCVLH